MSGRLFTEDNIRSAGSTVASTLGDIWDGVSGAAGRNPGWAKGIMMLFGGILALNLMENMQWKFWIPAMLTALLALDVGTSAAVDHFENREKGRQTAADISTEEKGRRFETARLRLEGGRAHDNTGGGYSSSSPGQSQNNETRLAPASLIPGFGPD